MFTPALLATKISAACITMAEASDIRVKVIGTGNESGSVGCAKRSSSTSFPMGRYAPDTNQISGSVEGAVRSFEDVASGIHATSVANQLNSNPTTDRNTIGIQTGAREVSRNVRPALRAPRFAEAAFEVGVVPVAVTVEVN